MDNKKNTLHLNYSIIVDLIEKNSTVLDLGCGDGTLLSMLIKEKNVQGRGIDIDQKNVIETIKKGISVIKGNIDEGLKDYKDKVWDYVILNQTLQSAVKPDFVIEEMLRVGKRGIVSFPNFAYLPVRTYLFFKGKMPKSKMLPYEWYNTPNIHLLTVRDFFEFCAKRNIIIEKTIMLRQGKVINLPIKKILTDLYAEEVIFVIKK